MMRRGREGDGGKKGGGEGEGESARARELCQRGGCTSYRNTQQGKSAQRENQTDTTRRTKNKTKQKTKNKIPAITAIMSQTVKTCAETA